MLTRFIRNQLIVFAALTLAALVALGLVLPSDSRGQLGCRSIPTGRRAAGVRGGLYRTSNVDISGNPRSVGVHQG